MLQRGILLLACFCAAAAQAGGNAIPDLGAGGLGQAGATVARPDDATAMYYNPAGLAFQDGLRAYADVRVVDQRVEFQRLNAAGQNPAGWAPVENSGGASPAPILGLTYRYGRFAFGVGGNPQNGATGYHFPNPDDARAAGASDAGVGRAAPQRYMAVDSTSRIFMPVFAAAVRITDWLGFGAALQLPWADFRTKVAVYAGPVPGELTAFDALVDIHATQWFARSGVLGLTAQPTPWLAAGLGLQLVTHFRAEGTADAELPPAAKELGLTVDGNKANIDILFPWVLRGGVRIYQSRWSAELAGTFEKWSELKAITIRPENIQIKLGGSPVALPTLLLPKALNDSGSIRLGGEFQLNKLVTLRAGALYETAATPTSRQALDWVHWDRFSVNAGAMFSWGRYTAQVAASRFLQADRDVRDSQITQLVAFPGEAQSVTGNGNYSSQITVVSASIAAKFDY
jgi:long-chain fatty acid transport protein